MDEFVKQLSAGVGIDEGTAPDAAVKDLKQPSAPRLLAGSNQRPNSGAGGLLAEHPRS